MSVLTTLRAWDPDLVNLRKAARATLVTVPLLAVMYAALGLGSVSTFAFFAGFVGLVFANFGGPRRPRAMAYAAMIVIGNILIIIGSLLSGIPFAGAVGMFVVMFAVSFATVLGGYAPAFVAPVALAYSLAVLDPLSSLAIDLRVLGWTIGGVAALIAGLLLWPVDRRDQMRRLLAEASRGIADALAAGDDRKMAEAGYQRAEAAMTDARRRAGAPLRPIGPLSRDVGLLHLIEHLEQALDMTRRVLDEAKSGTETEALRAASIGAFRRTEDVLLEKADPRSVTENFGRLEDALRAGHRVADEAAIREADSSIDGEDAATAVSNARLSFPIMALSRMAMWVEASVAVAYGAGDVIDATGMAPEVRPASDRPGEIFRRARSIVLRELDPDGVIFRNSVRAGAAMGLAVLVAQAVPIQHGFWVALAALLVLHSSAASTSATALQAVVGAVLGFAAAAVILWFFGDSDTALWILLPCSVFFAAYSPNVAGFMTGQVAFTVLVVILFTIIDPVGIATAVARVEAVLLGATSGAAMALVLWPHGARIALAHAVAGAYRRAVEGLRGVADDSPQERAAANMEMYGARRHADHAFAIALGERGDRIDARMWLPLFRAPVMVHSLVAALRHPAPPWLRQHCATAVAATIDHQERVADALTGVADRLDPTHAILDRATAAGAHSADLSASLEVALDRARPLGLDRVEEVRRLIVWNEWLSYIETDLSAAEPELAHVADVSRPGAWLRWSLRPRAHG